MYWMHSGMGGWGPLAVLLDVAVLVAVAVVLVVVLSGGRWGHPPDRGTGRASRIPAERYARGEIGEDEYHRRRAILRSGR